MLTRRLRLPYSVGLVAAGIVVAIFPLGARFSLNREIIYTALLPPLLFEAAYHLRLKHLLENWPPITMLATLGVLLSAFVTAAGMHFLAGWEWIAASLLGVLIAATDTVSVVAIFKEAGIRGRLLMLLEGESLLNDGAAAVCLGLVVVFASGRVPSSFEIVLLALKVVLGGVLCGAAVAIVTLVLSGRTTDHLVELTFTTVAAYGSFLLADHFGMSGVLATITAGLVISNRARPEAISDSGVQAIESFWEFAAFVSNSIIFILIGIHETRQNFLAIWIPALIAIALSVVSRAAAVYPLNLVFHWTRYRVSFKHQHILFWGGFRGALALALALGLPLDLPMREQIIAICFAVVAFSVFVQGLSMTPLLRRLGEIPHPTMPVNHPESKRQGECEASSPLLRLSRHSDSVNTP
jgi:monovalent cation:H+ antiporter, CPA1 family